MELIGETYHSAQYKTDNDKGICKNMDKSSVRYINVARNQAFKMKSGKFMRALILETEIGKLLSPGVLNWIPEMSSHNNGIHTSMDIPPMARNFTWMTSLKNI